MRKPLLTIPFYSYLARESQKNSEKNIPSQACFDQTNYVHPTCFWSAKNCKKKHWTFHIIFAFAIDHPKNCQTLNFLWPLFFAHAWTNWPFHSFLCVALVLRTRAYTKNMVTRPCQIHGFSVAKAKKARNPRTGISAKTIFLSHLFPRIFAGKPRKKGACAPTGMAATNS